MEPISPVSTEGRAAMTCAVSGPFPAQAAVGSAIDEPEQDGYPAPSTRTAIDEVTATRQATGLWSGNRSRLHNPVGWRVARTRPATPHPLFRPDRTI